MTDDKDFFAGGLIRIDDYPAERYFSDDFLPDELKPALSASLAVDFHKHSPAKAAYSANRNKTEAYSAPMVFGSVAHSVILQQAGWSDDIEVLDKEYKDWRTKAAQEWRKAMLAKGKLPIKQSDMDEIWAMRQQWNSGDLTKLLTVAGSSEVSLTWRCPETWCICKVRWDFLPNDDFLLGHYPAIDYKTTANLDDWPRINIARNNLLLRMALYYESLLHLTGEMVNMAYAVQEKEPPYQVQVHTIILRGKNANPRHQQMIDAARAMLLPVKQGWAKCQKNNHWPHRKELVAFDVDDGLIAKTKDKPIAAQSITEAVTVFDTEAMT